MKDHYCEDSYLELRGCKGNRWPVDPARFTFCVCYKCGKTWIVKDNCLGVTVKSESKQPFAVYKYINGSNKVQCVRHSITDGAIGFELKEA